MPLLDSAQKVIKVTLSGTMLGGAEIWQTGFFIGSATQDAPAPTQAAADTIRDAWSTYFTSTAASINNTYAFTGVKLARLNKNGDYDQSVDVVQSYPTTAKNGASASAAFPPQVSLAATLIAGSGKGLGGKGRMYLPGVNVGIDSTGHISTATAQTMANALATFFNTYDASPNTLGHVINVSRGHAKLLGAGARNIPINGVRIGNVYDTQRRRRNGLNEVYVSAVVAD